MDVQLYVYDLSNGLARSLSPAFLGIQIDAVYHTSIVMEGVEYVYDGGIKMVNPGKTHLGRPMEILQLGKTQLPFDVILEYIESLKEIYTIEVCYLQRMTKTKANLYSQAYDIFSHNCNNFTNDLATFMLGKGIPDHIANLPQTVLNTPFGRAIQPEIHRQVQKNRQATGGILGINDEPSQQPLRASLVREVTSNTELDKLLEEADKTCAVIFFTSKNCPPCKTLYPLYEELATAAGHKAVLIKVDVSRSYDIGTKYSIRATPTFLTFLHGTEENRWAGSEPATLRGNVEMLIQMAWPAHKHTNLPLPALRSANTKPVLYSKVPPLGKLKARMGPSAEDASVSSVMHFISIRAESGAAEATLPSLDAFSRFLRSAPSKLPPEIMFTIVDVLRVALVDPRFSGYYAEEKEHKTIAPLLSYINSLKDCPYSLRLVALQMACNLFSSPLYPEHILNCPSLTTPIVQLIATSLLDDKHHNVRVAAASLAFNISAANSRLRTEQHLESLPEEHQIELAASLLEAISVEEETPEALKGFLLALGYLVYCVPKGGELVDLLKSMDARGTVLGKGKLFPREVLVKDIGEVLLGRGLE
jgi:desumoylating isopeptidase 1